MAKPHVTRTFGPIHFEDLDPHRFEDLVRQGLDNGVRNHFVSFRAWTMVSGTILCVGAPWEETVVVDLLFLEKIVQGATWVVKTP
jgi:hypothetical protein